MRGVKITFHPSRISGVVPKGITLLEAARSLGVDVDAPCGGSGKCGRDLVQIRKEGSLHTVLACKTLVETDLEVICRQHEEKSIQIVEGFFAGGNRTFRIGPSLKKELKPDEHGRCFTGVYDTRGLFLPENGYTKDHTYGIAIDIGTTTLVASLVDLTGGALLGSSSVLNPLVYYGHDVMSRIKYAAVQKDGLRSMHRELISAVNFLIQALSSERSIRPEHIYHIIGAGNTTMQHIFLNKEIQGIGAYPYQAKTLDTCTTTAQELSVDIAANAPVTTFPCISAYVGGDIVSGLLAIDVPSLETPALFLDIGTNGEIALVLNDKIIVSSTAAGPCFEGMTISSGMRAGEGAIEHVRFDKEMPLDVIGGGQPRGICGSGLLDVVSELVRTGLVNARGRLQSPESENTITQQTATKSTLPGKNSASGLLSPDAIPPVKGDEGGCKATRSGKESFHRSAVKYKSSLFEKEGKRHFRLADAVSVSQEDIRQVQLAKAAIRAGVEILLAKCQVKAEGLRTIIIAGGFGYHLDKKSLFGIGLLPEATHARLSFVGNSSLEGAVGALFDTKLMDQAVQIARTAQVVELSQIPEFESLFIREMHF